MDNFEFNDYYETSVFLPTLTQKGKVENENFERRCEFIKRHEGFCNLKFEDLENWEGTTNPTQVQLNTLEYIKDHQQELIEAFFDYTKSVLYPTHIEYIGYDEVSFPEINTVDDLKLSLAIDTIHIMTKSKNDLSYFGIYFNFSGDYEHGTYLVLYGNKVLGWEENLGHDLIDKDLNSI